MKYELKNMIYFLELWYSSLKKIEGNFGSGVGSFFQFLRTIFILNFCIAIISIAFIVVPQMLHMHQSNVTEEHADFYWGDIFTGTVS